MLPPPPNARRQWVRPLIEEGIEPHPGPRYISRNANGLASKGRFEDAIRQMELEHRRSPVGAFFIQEHNLNRSLAERCSKIARKYRILWLARYKPAADHAGKGHGTGVAIPFDSIELKAGESLDRAIARVQRSLTGNQAGSITVVSTIIAGTKRNLICAYAPAQGASRPAFFRNGLGPYLTRNTEST